MDSESIYEYRHKIPTQNSNTHAHLNSPLRAQEIIEPIPFWSNLPCGTKNHPIYYLLIYMISLHSAFIHSQPSKSMQINSSFLEPLRMCAVRYIQYQRNSIIDTSNCIRITICNINEIKEIWSDCKYWLSAMTQCESTIRAYKTIWRLRHFAFLPHSSWSFDTVHSEFSI